MAAAIIWMAVMAALIHAGAQHDYWLQRSLDPDAPQPYATGKVATFALMSTVEIAVVMLIVRPWRWHRLWLRLLIAFVVLLAWTLPLAMGAMHQSPVYGTHLLWLMLLDLGLFLALWSVTSISVWQALRARAEAQTKNAPLRERSS
ncbi:hypothetical protein [Stenotrophomonas sp. ESTM1D_MKCIP4_1]|uniref:hypothetical protein n=1 Tax=Stenotrophomonas sp. ESTM1D_MKCIP4_1 TaxID=2072414 RepID=UPI0031B57443